ncbi:MAG: metallophosphoesterase [Lachnospiraceae bacterium]|jgi:predicted phosphodiesterase|nr:metallophosphoesterase [Lachnospiraceae bacterium]
MKILAIGDQESKLLWDFFDKSMLEGIDLIISCGDLDPRYLSFLVTLSSVPVLYVHGNHDGKYEQIPPEGCVCIDDRVYVHEGVRILGLGGSMRYKPGPHQYTEREMKQRVRKLWFRLFRSGGFDILVTHSPAYQLNDGRDLPHQGFQVFRELIETYRPKFFLHGHVHMTYGRQHKRYDKYLDTHILNVYEKCTFEFEDDDPQSHLY